MAQNTDMALRSLQGVAIGDALGETFFGPAHAVLPNIENRQIPPGTWEYTDDTEMAISVTEMLIEQGEIDQDGLATKFADRFSLYRGYGGNARELLLNIKRGGDWRLESAGAFSGTGSYGNGAAMRATPVGAYFGKDTAKVVEAARKQAKITHYHPEGIAGAVAVALAASYYDIITNPAAFDYHEYLDFIITHIPQSRTRDGIAGLKAIPDDLPVTEVVAITGSGFNISAEDTVPFVIRTVGLHYYDFTEAFWHCVEGLGDRDTTCAMTCGIVALTSKTPIPDEWIKRTESIDLLKG